jgi:osmoprotectant transport system permease protein
MRALGDLVRWLTDPANWQGPHGIPVRVLEHIELSGFSVLVALLIAMPIALYLGHTGRAGFIAINVANVGRALPSLALLAFGLVIAISLGLGLGFWPTVFALVPLAIPPILTNSYVAIREVDRDVVEAARGMGLSEAQILRSIEVPLGLPLMLSGLRTAAVNVVALQEYDQLMAGALLVALLAVATEVSFAALERATVPPGMVATR